MFRVFNSELILGVLVLLTLLTCIHALFVPCHTLNYEALVFCAMIIGYLLINKVLCYRPDMRWLFKIRRLH